MSFSEQERRELRRRVEKELKAEKLQVRIIFFSITLLIYVLFMVIGWGMFLANGGAQPIPGVEDNPLVGGMVMLSVAGFLGVLFQFISLMLETRQGERQMRDRIAARVLSSAMLRLGYGDEEHSGEETEREKAKRIMRLSDDGELEEVIDEEPPEEKSLQTRQRL